MGGIFISYRREEAEGYAGRLFDKLKEHFGRERVFMDVDAIEPGVDFVDALNKALGSCDVLIAVIGRLWLTVADAGGKRRLDDPLDYIRLETKIALERDIKVIPVLIQDTLMPPEGELPDDLKKLARRQALKLSSDRWDYDIGRLIESLEKGVGITPSTIPGTQAGDGRKPAVAAASRSVSSVGTKLVLGLILTAIIVASAGYYRHIRIPDNKPVLPNQNVIPPATATLSPKPAQVLPGAAKPLPINRSEPAVTSPPKVPLTPTAKRTRYSVQLSEDRGTVIIVGPAGQETDHISLDPDRVQKVFNAPDGKWSVAVIKVRNKPQYGAMPINLSNGSALETAEIPAMPNSVTFERMAVVMGFENSGTKRINLQN